MERRAAARGVKDSNDLLPGPIRDLSESEEDSCDLAPEPEELLKKKKRKRFKDGPTHKERLLDVQGCKQLLQKRCGGKCKKACLKQFQSTHVFQKLMDFRQKWSELHKLDADRLVPR